MITETVVLEVNHCKGTAHWNQYTERFSRTVIVEITDSSNKSKQLMCSIQHIIPIEVKAEESDDRHQKKDPLRLDNVELQQLQDNFNVDSKTITISKHLNIY